MGPAVKVHDINAGRRDSFGLLQSVLMNVIGLYVSCKFGGTFSDSPYSLHGATIYKVT